jgi:hypothetical protein
MILLFRLSLVFFQIVNLREDVRISAVPNVDVTCYLLQACVLLYLIGGWQEGQEASAKLSMRLLCSMDPRKKEEADPSSLVKQVVEAFFPGPARQQDLLEAFMRIEGGLSGTAHYHVFTEEWTSCPCGLESAKTVDWESVIVVSTEQEFINLEDEVNKVVRGDQDNDKGWKCTSENCGRRKETTKLCMIAEVGTFVLVYITRPFHRPRTSVTVPKEMMIATYQEASFGAQATLVPAYLVYVVCHSTKDGDVPDEGHPDSVSNAETGHYFGCGRSQNGDGVTVDCLADPRAARAVDFNKWVDERPKKVTMAVYTTEKPSWWKEVRILSCVYVCVCVCVCVCV